jgi:hypothetical protein
MKKLLTLAFVCLAYATSFGQNVPQGIAYQAVAVKDGAYSVAGQNPQAIYWSNKEIKVRFTIFEKYPNGSSQYSEVHTTSTDDYGVFNLIIGQGSGLSGDFTTIPWELGDAHLQVEIDFENTNTFTLTALEKFWSVPYAFVTNETGTSSTDSSLAALDSLNKALKAEIAALRFSDKDTVVGNELQTLSVSGDSVTISDGNAVVINHPANLDNDPANEIQQLSLNNDTISLSNGNAVKIEHPANLDNDPANEIQAISLNNDTISLSGGGGDIALEDIKSYVNSSSGTSGLNGTVDDMFFGVRPDLAGAEPLLYLDADTVYALGITNRSTPYVIKIFPDGSRDTLIQLNRSAATVNEMIVSLPFFYHKSYTTTNVDIYHLDTGFVRVARTSIPFTRTIADSDHNLIFLDRGGYSYKVGNIYFYNFKNDTTYTITNPDFDYRGLTIPQIINDSSLLIAPRIWRTNQDTITPTGQVIGFYNQNGGDNFFVPIVINSHKILFEGSFIERLGNSSGWKTTLNVYDLETSTSQIVDAVAEGGGTNRIFNFMGVSDNKMLYWRDYNPTSFGSYPNYYYWFDTEGNYSANFLTKDGSIDIATEFRCKYRRISVRSGSIVVNGFTSYSFPNVNYTKPTSGRTYLHE